MTKSAARRRGWTKQVMDELGIQYSARPEVETGYVAPTLFHLAHTMYTTPEGHVLYLGPKSAASQRAFDALHDANVKAVVNCTIRIPCYHRQHLRYCQVTVHDELRADIFTYLDGTAAFIDVMLKRGSVLVHCEQGISRSTTVVMSYLMRFHGKTRDEAYIWCKTKRPMVNPNEGFWKQLEAYQESLSKTVQSSKNENGPTNESMLLQWVPRSHSLYVACREIPEVLETDCCWEFLERVYCDPILMTRILFVCLDFVWGRGVLDLDIDWLLFVYRKLPTTSANATIDSLELMLREPDSEFCQAWSGEIREVDVHRILEKAGQASSELCEPHSSGSTLAS